MLTHTRCHLGDAKLALETGVDGIDVVFGTSRYLREYSHGKSMDEVIETAVEVVQYIRSHDVEVRFSTEDSFRSELADLIRAYRAVNAVGVNRVGVADTVGVASPRQVYDLVRRLRQEVDCDIEFHGHNDTGCAVANAFCALEAGATHVDTSVLGIGERNGITPLGGLVARLYAEDPAGVRARYDLPLLREIENYVASLVEVDVPFNNYITGYTAFTHKAGIHAKAILNDPSSYEILDPADFGLDRYVHVAHRLTGCNAIKSRVEQLRHELSDAQIKEITAHIKALADEKPLSLSDVDTLLRNYHTTTRRRSPRSGGSSSSRGSQFRRGWPSPSTTRRRRRPCVTPRTTRKFAPSSPSRAWATSSRSVAASATRS